VRTVTKHRRLLALAAVAAAAATLVAALAGGSGSAATRASSVNVALDWFPNPDHVALYYALDKGYFTKRGVNVSMKTPSDPSAGLKLVATNKFDLAVYYEGDMFYAGQQGLPVFGPDVYNAPPPAPAAATADPTAHVQAESPSQPGSRAAQAPRAAVANTPAGGSVWRVSVPAARRRVVARGARRHGE
jgi:putative hydroxymethylpyrimidine transport system substrate-binding protein